MCTSFHNNTSLHLLSCCLNKHINNLSTSRHNTRTSKHTLCHPTTQCNTLTNSFKIKEHIDSTIPLRLFPCTCYLSRCKCLAQLQPYILWLLGAPPIARPPFTPNPNLKVQIFNFTCFNDNPITTHYNHHKNTRGIIHTTTTKQPIEDRHDIISEVMGIWKNNTKFRYLFSHP